MTKGALTTSTGKRTQEQIAEALADIVGATHVSSAPADVDAYGGLAPFVVVWPSGPVELARVLKLCGEQGVVVGTAGLGARAKRHWPVPDGRPRAALDTRRMSAVLELDTISLTVHCQSGIQIRHLEAALRHEGLTLGPYPVELQASTLGGLLAAPSPTAHSPRTGWFTEACLGMTVALADGTQLQTRVAPRRATGPDLARLFIGSRGALGVITTATLRVYRRPEAELVFGIGCAGMVEGVDIAAAVLAAGVRPARLRLLGERQAQLELGEGARGCGAVLLFVLSGLAPQNASERRLIQEIVRESGCRDLPGAVAERWWARHSAWKKDEPPRDVRVGARLRHSELGAALASLPPACGAHGRHEIRVWVEELTPHEGTLWLSCDANEGAAPALRSLLLDSGLDPFRFDFPPLMEELRAQLDPQGTLVVMEGEWTGS